MTTQRVCRLEYDYNLKRRYPQYLFGIKAVTLGKRQTTTDNVSTIMIVVNYRSDTSASAIYFAYF